MTAALTLWTPPPAPDTADWTARHQRGVIRLPHPAGPDQRTGDLVPAWVCCDPACLGVEPGEDLIQLNHCCCGSTLFRGGPSYRSKDPADVPGAEQRGLHRVGLGTVGFTGSYHGPFTAWWEPGDLR